MPSRARLPREASDARLNVPYGPLDLLLAITQIDRKANRLP